MDFRGKRKVNTGGLPEELAMKSEEPALVVGTGGEKVGFIACILEVLVGGAIFK